MIRAWRHLIDQVGVVGVFAAALLAWMTLNAWYAWPRDRLFIIPVWWIAVFAQVRSIRERDRRRAVAREVLMRVQSRLEQEDADVIRKGLQ